MGGMTSTNRAEYMRTWRKSMRERGLCPSCGKLTDTKPNGEHFHLCAACRAKAAPYNRDYSRQFQQANPPTKLLGREVVVRATGEVVKVLGWDRNQYTVREANGNASTYSKAEIMVPRRK